MLTAEAKQRKAHREKARRVNLNGLCVSAKGCPISPRGLAYVLCTY